MTAPGHATVGNSPDGVLLPVTFFLKAAPGFVPPSLWQWLAGRFYSVDERGEEQLRPTPALMPERLWRLLGKQVFSIDVYKHRLFQQAAPALLQEMHALAPDVWLFAGTLLGWARDGRIIPWDRDIDLGIPSEVVTDELLDRFRTAGFVVERTHRYELPSYREYVSESMGQYSKVVLRKAGGKVELCCFAPGKGNRLYFGKGRPKLFAIDRDLVYPLTKAPMYGFMVNVPERFDAHLEYVYGKDWRTPKPAWIRSPEHRQCQQRFFVDLNRPGSGKSR